MPPARKVVRRKRNAQATRALVLQAAEEIFAEKGYEGASMRDFARRAKVGQPLIQYHFGSKEKLWLEVKARVMGRFASIWPEEPRANVLEEMAHASLALFRILNQDRKLLRLFSWTRLQDPPALWPGEREAIEDICRRLEEGQRKGQIRQGLNPTLIAMALIALVIYWCEERERMVSLFPDRRIPDEAYLNTLYCLMAGGVKA